METIIFSPKGSFLRKEWKSENVTAWLINQAEELRLGKAKKSSEHRHYVKPEDYLVSEGYLIIEKGDGYISVLPDEGFSPTPEQYICLLMRITTMPSDIINALIAFNVLDKAVVETPPSEIARQFLKELEDKYYEDFRKYGCNTHDYNRDVSNIKYYIKLLESENDDNKRLSLIVHTYLALHRFMDFCKIETHSSVLEERYYELGSRFGEPEIRGYLKEKYEAIRSHLELNNHWDYGLSGYLAPDGRFYRCGYQEHGDLAKILVEKYSLNIRNLDTNSFGDFIKFGCSKWLDNKEGDHGCHVFFNMREAKLTEKQLEWLKENWLRMTVSQSLEMLRIADYFDKKRLFMELHEELKSSCDHEAVRTFE